MLCFDIIKFGCPFEIIPYSRKYWRSLNLAVWTPNDIFHTIVGLKFGGMVRYRHTYMHTEKNLADFNLAV